ncbi:choline transporter [Luteipulveratus halotolerans]|uniref:Choline transporter n=1 Tax=Luteipulveratus halotolerans TaxID=1631356 RepID=A0A0L6CNF4_9MICO|nr:BCCT family transporter [Luteipulveratus halotolerans]KNX39185.1 choline transporter [Luteipulveratus halotolerans]
MLGGITAPISEGLRAGRGGGLDKVIFGVAAVVAVGFVIWGFALPDNLSDTSGSALSWVMESAGWAFVLLASLFVVFAIWLAASRYGNIPLGADDEEPEFKTVSWIAMMFSAGMGIGLMFWGVAEPLNYFSAPPPDTGIDPQTTEAMKTAMATTLFHWTLHPWAIYAVVGVAIAYGTFRKGRSQLISSAFRSLLGDRTDGPIGKVIDMLAIFATLFGSAASLGLGALQIGAGLEANGWVDKVGKVSLVAIITVLTICFILSAVSGVSRGIQWLSNINMVLALALALFVFVVGPTVFILDLLPTSFGSYIDNLPGMAARTDASGDAELAKWLSSWTVFYWAWWISWTPFVGMFIARISRGRTIRQFVTGVLLVPSVVSLVWFAIFGGSAIDVQRDSKDLVQNVKGVATVNSDTALFQLLDHYPIASVTTVLVMVLVGIFFVSGADAASIVMGSLSERGTLEPSRPTVIFWGVLTGGVAAVMLLAGFAENADDPGAALTSLQNITIVAALPFVVVMAAMCVALVKDLQADPMMRRAALGQEMVERAVVAGVTEHGHDDLVLVAEELPEAERGAEDDDDQSSGSKAAQEDRSGPTA